MGNYPLLCYLREIGVVREVPDGPAPGTVLGRGRCFLHGGDNPTSLAVYHDGFICHTRQCHHTRQFGHNLHGLIRRMVDRLGGPSNGWQAPWRFACEHRAEMRRLAQGWADDAPAVPRHRPDGPLPPVKDCLDCPDRYYLSRGYPEDTLRHFGVGTCCRHLPDGKRLIGWSVIPFRPHTASPDYMARNPDFRKGSNYAKWVNSVGREQLFRSNHWVRADRLVLCEGAGDVMRLWQAGFPGGLAALGNAITPAQIDDLATYGRDKPLWVVGDNDRGGHDFVRRVTEAVGRDVTVGRVPGHRHDLGECSAEEIRGVFAR